MFFKQESSRTDKKAKRSSNCEDFMGDSSQSKLNYSNHYHLKHKNPTAINIMSGVKSLICDLNGIIIAEMVYRCMICDVIYETIPEVQMHYQLKHIEEDNQNSFQNHSNSLTNSSISSTANRGNTTTNNFSFFDSFLPSNDIIFESLSNSSPTNTLTFDVPSGLKTLQQQFQTSPKKKTIKSSTSVNTKNKQQTENKELKNKSVLDNKSKGLITCEICGATKFYKYLQRRYGVYSCVGCAKFYSKYLLKPMTYTCENLGKCNLKVSECEPNGRCKACLIHKCKSKFIIDPKKLSNNNKMNLSLSRSNSSKKVFSAIKTKKFDKPINGRDSSRTLKGKPSTSMASDSKTKTTSTPNNLKTKEIDSLHINKSSTSLNSPKKIKSEKTNQKVIHEKNGISTKTSPTINCNPKISAEKVSVSARVKRSSISSQKSNVLKNVKRTRQTSCRKCSACKTKDCNNCVNCLDRPRNGGKDKIRQKCIKRKCLNHNSRNN